ncbi:lipase [Trametes cingulata]|nr:lipase [Trametes cingulata]
MASPRLGALLFAALSLACAVALPPSGPQQPVTVLPSDQVSAFKPYSHYASAAFCPPASTLSWDCGVNCDSNPSFIPVASGGDGAVTQYWYVGFDPILSEVIVAHQGTDVDKILPDLTDVDILLLPLDQSLFPGVRPPVLVHQGFAATHSRSAPHILDAVQLAMSRFGATAVTVVGHSLGAAISLLDAVYLPLHLPDATVRYIGYGLPRVGNSAFAKYVDSLPISVTHVTNREDPIPVLPPMALGFHHPSGEVHIRPSNDWVACPGEDNPSEDCSLGEVSLLTFNEANHDGPYDGVVMGC